jgi:hypothetical protein
MAKHRPSQGGRGLMNSDSSEGPARRRSPPRTAHERGHLVARILRGAWRPTPPPLDFSAEQLASLAPILHRQGSSGLAWARIRGTPLAEIPEALLLRDGFRYHTLRVRLLETQLARLNPLFRDRGVEPVLGKGWAMGRLYPEPGLRPYGDLDFLVPSPQMKAAEEALAAQEETRPAVELHASFNELEDRSPEELASRSRLEELDGVPIRIFSPEDHLRLLALHGLEHGLCRPLWLCDVALFLESIPKDFDWEYAGWGAPWLTDGVRCSLGLSRELLGVDLDTVGVPAVWGTAPLPKWMARAALGAFGADAHYMDLLHPEELLLKPRKLARAARLRWANPIEVTFRRRAPWNDGSRLPHQLADYLLRGVRFSIKAPGTLIDAWKTNDPPS